MRRLEVLLVLIAALLFVCVVAKPGSDFSAPYVAAEHAAAAYMPATSLLAQELHYGRAALPGEDEHRFAYPAYALFVFLPLTLLPITRAFVLWQLIQIALVVAALSRLGVRPLMTLALCFALKEPLVSISLGQCVLWSVGWLGFALDALRRGHDRSGAVFAALAGLMQPVLVLPLLFVLLGRSRRALLLWLALMASVTVLSVIAFGGWVPDWIATMRAYPTYVSYLTWLPQIAPLLVVPALPTLLYAWTLPDATERAALGLAALLLLLPLTGLYALSLALPVLARLPRSIWGALALVVWALSVTPLDQRRAEVVVVALGLLLGVALRRSALQSQPSATRVAGLRKETT